MSTRAVYQPRSAKRTHISHSAISTPISKANSHRHSRARVLFFKGKIQLAQPYIEMSNKAKALLDDTAVSTSAVYQRRSEKRKHTWHSRISRAISRTNEHLAQQAMMGVYPHSGITNQPSGNTTGTDVHQQQTAKKKTLLDDAAMSTRAVRQPRSANRKHIWHRCISTAISKANLLRHSRARD